MREKCKITNILNGRGECRSISLKIIFYVILKMINSTSKLASFINNYLWHFSLWKQFGNGNYFTVRVSSEINVGLAMLIRKIGRFSKCMSLPQERPTNWLVDCIWLRPTIMEKWLWAGTREPVLNCDAQIATCWQQLQLLPLRNINPLSLCQWCVILLARLPISNISPFDLFRKRK